MMIITIRIFRKGKKPRIAYFEVNTQLNFSEISRDKMSEHLMFIYFTQTRIYSNNCLAFKDKDIYNETDVCQIRRTCLKQNF